MEGARASSLEQARGLVRSDKTSDGKAWLKLMHFRPTLFGAESDIDGEKFFLSPRGKTSPEAELQATLTAFFDPQAMASKEEDSALCRFPARQRFLRERFPQITWPGRECGLLQRYRQAVSGPSVSLVFSSFYLNNPSSAFGHTFLRVNKVPAQSDGRRYELLDYGFNYAADPDTDNAFVYGVKGLFGGFKGTFTSVPYYYKVREYNNHESRDLWQYELSLTPAQVSMLVDHLWELGSSYADYWYMTENCSFHILTALEAAAPDLEIVAKLKKFVLPADTVHAVVETPGLVKTVTYRPSLRTQLFARFDALSATEQNAVLKIVNDRDLAPLNEIAALERQSAVLDAAVDLIDYRFPYEIQLPEEKITQFKNRVLSRRGDNPTISTPLDIPLPVEEEPHRGHGSRRWGLGGRKVREGRESLLFSYRFALHDFYDPKPGFPDSAQITMFEGNFSWTEKIRRLELEQLTLFEVISRSPWRRLTPDYSWSMKVAGEREPWDEKPATTVMNLQLGGGWTLANASDSLSLFGGLKGGLKNDLQGRFDHFRVTAGPALGVRARISPRFVTGAEGWWRRERRREDKDFREISATVQWQFARDWGLRASAKDAFGAQSGELMLFGYY
ncbi:MAG: DUF4105 domain-containing protein [Bdellovibrionaceae bacterium]|nr:DUF4105 domain-containing protein [Pseudobdellovibrionaceae bacterium]